MLGGCLWKAEVKRGRKEREGKEEMEGGDKDGSGRREGHPQVPELRSVSPLPRLPPPRPGALKSPQSWLFHCSPALPRNFHLLTARANLLETIRAPGDFTGTGNIISVP